MKVSLPLISVIVPFYNVSDCVDYCVASLLAQTYERCEIILVDDGSSDSTAEKLDAYRSDARTKVCHIENRGLSGARNYGVEVARGDYIVFVDGDDYVHPSLVAALYEALPKSSKGIVLSSGKTIKMSVAKSPSCMKAFDDSAIGHRTLVREEALADICHDVVGTSAWANLVPTDFYRSHPFPQGAVYEDTYMIGELIRSFDLISILNTSLYGYVMRDGSISKAKKTKIKQARDYLQAIEKFRRDTKDLRTGHEAQLAYFEDLHLSRLHTLCNSVADDKVEAKRIDRQAIKRIAETLPLAATDTEAPKNQLKRFALLVRAPKLYDALFAVYNKLAKGV